MENVKGILLDIEGTTSSIRFVYDVMFPYVRQALDDFLSNHWNSDELQDCLPLLAEDLGFDSVDAWLGDKDESGRQLAVSRAVVQLMDDDVKATGLKQLQGIIWRSGFHSGQLVSHLYDDVEPAVRAWNAKGLDVRIYSSGSIAAQKLFFGHTVNGDLLDQFGGHYDTTTGSKKESSSYEKIAADFGLPAQQILFISDVPEELDAAESIGMRVRLSKRPGNKPVDDQRWDPVAIDSFSALKPGA